MKVESFKLENVNVNNCLWIVINANINNVNVNKSVNDKWNESTFKHCDYEKSFWKIKNVKYKKISQKNFSEKFSFTKQFPNTKLLKS